MAGMSRSPSGIDLASEELYRLGAEESAQASPRTLYMFFQHGGHGHGIINHSLYTVETPTHPFPPIPSPQSLQSQKHNPTPIQPTLLFHTTDFPSWMRCAQLGSKFYFLGGRIDFKDGKPVQHRLKREEEEEEGESYPPDMYIFYPTTTTITNPNANAFHFVTPGPPMNSGKRDLKLLFVAYGKIYALSSPIFRLPGVEYFEVFNPITNTWAPLPPPPFREGFNIQHALVKRKVYIIGGRRPYSSGVAVNCFDLDKKEWLPSSILKCLSLHMRYLIADFVKDTLYGHFNGCIVAFGPVKDTDEDGDGQFFQRKMYLSQESPLNSCMVCPMMEGESGSLIHLENKRFCFVASGNPPQPNPENPAHLISDTQTRYISVTIFEALSDTFTDKVGETYSKAKFLHSVHFVANTPWEANLAVLSDCFLADTGS